jgi:SAM-dependent methyltransferase
VSEPGGAARSGEPSSGGSPAAGPSAADDPRGFYTAGYSLADRSEADRMGRWRALGARSKAEHAVALCAAAGLRPGTIVEIGCGDGALLAELGARGLAPVLDGFELSPPAAELARARSIPGARRIEAYDGRRVPAGDGAYDLAVLSHVLEHVEDPAALLREAARVAPAVLVEVPLERNRSAARPAKRAEAARIGHIQFLDRAAVHGLVAAAGLRVAAELTDPLPLAHRAFFAASRAARARAGLKAGLRRAAWRLAPRAAERLFTVHYACLARRR